MSEQVNSPICDDFQEGQKLLRPKNPPDIRDQQRPLSVEVVSQIAPTDNEPARVELMAVTTNAAFRSGTRFRMTVDAAKGLYAPA